MTERNIPEQRNFKEYKESIFEELRRDTRIFTKEQYAELFCLAKEHWGIDSPAFVFPKALFPRHPNQEIIPQEIQGEALIVINGDAVPDPEYIKYLCEHEYTEYYVSNKEGFNLRKFDTADYQLPILERRRPSHRVAVLKEYEMAAKDGKLDAYMEWWRSFYLEDIENVRQMSPEELERISKNYGPGKPDPENIIKFIMSNLQIREEIYQKIKAKA